MTEVGRLFNVNELIVAEVLQSAEAMKAAVNHLEQFMEKADTASRGKIVLATVKGDVHDIGKNLVEIILSNNGYQVINLGIKVAPDDLIQAWREHQPDAIGLSGLLVKSAHQMVTTASDFKEQRRRRAAAGGRSRALRTLRKHAHRPGLRRPHLLCQRRHDRPAMMNELMDPSSRDAALADHIYLAVEPVARDRSAAREGPGKRPQPRVCAPTFRFPPFPDLDRHVRDVPNLQELWSYMNPLHALRPPLWGSKATSRSCCRRATRRRWNCIRTSKRVKEKAAKFLKPRAVWQFFEAERHGNSVQLFAPGGIDCRCTHSTSRASRNRTACA